MNQPDHLNKISLILLWRTFLGFRFAQITKGTHRYPASELRANNPVEFRMNVSSEAT